jgi:hypothetical protein
MLSVIMLSISMLIGILVIVTILEKNGYYFYHGSAVECYGNYATNAHLKYVSQGFGLF